MEICFLGATGTVAGSTLGETVAAAARVQHVEQTLHWPARVPEYLETVVLK